MEDTHLHENADSIFLSYWNKLAVFFPKVAWIFFYKSQFITSYVHDPYCGYN